MFQPAMRAEDENGLSAGSVGDWGAIRVLVVRSAAQRGRYDPAGLQGWIYFPHDGQPGADGVGPLFSFNAWRMPPGTEFGPHRHEQDEAITYLRRGRLVHDDEIGNRTVLVAGSVSVLSSASGVEHAERVPGDGETAELFQAVLRSPPRDGMPSFQTRYFGRARAGAGRPDLASGSGLRLLVSPDGSDGSLRSRQDVWLYDAAAEQGERLVHGLRPGRVAWLTIVAGRVELRRTDSEIAVAAGDAAIVRAEPEIVLRVAQASEVLLFDLPD